MGRADSSLPSSSSKRRTSNDDYAKSGSSRPRHKQHLYLALDDWKGGYSIHKIDADDIMDRDEPAAAGGRELHKLPEPAALRLASPVPDCPMAFAALGTDIFIATNPRCSHDRAPPTFVYNTETAALTIGPCLPDRLRDFGASMAVGERLYALTSVCLKINESPSFQVLSWEHATKPELGPWDPTMEWSWNSVPPPPPPSFNGIDIVTYALHPDGHTIFMSTRYDTHSFDTRSGVWKELGDWVLPFRGQAYFDGELDAWIGLHSREDGYVCCCPVASPSTVTMLPPQCKMLKEKLFRKETEIPDNRHLRTSLIYMGDSRFCLIENFMPREDVIDAVLHVTLFGLKYDHKGDLQTKIHRNSRSYAVSKNSLHFSHAAFWM